MLLLLLLDPSISSRKARRSGRKLGVFGVEDIATPYNPCAKPPAGIFSHLNATCFTLDRSKDPILTSLIGGPEGDPPSVSQYENDSES